MTERLAAASALVESLTTAGAPQVKGAVALARDVGVEPRALLGAGYINFGFNVINRIADGLGVALPESPDLNRAASLLLNIGYRPFSGRPFARLPQRPEALGQGVAQIALTAVHGPGVLEAEVRQALFAGTAHGALGQFGRAVAERASTLARADLEALRQDGYGEDEILRSRRVRRLGGGNSAPRLAA